MRKVLPLIAALLLILSTFAQAADYQLREVVVLSRHNIRAPLSRNGSVLSKVTPHKWFEWTAAPSELSLRGGELETLMGQYFRKYLVSQGLITENYLPLDGEVRFYSNTRQRTIATAQYFSSGMFPVANVRIEHQADTSKMDPVFHPKLTIVNDKFRAEATRQINVMGGSEGLKGINDSLAENYALLEKVLDFDKSQMHLENGVQHFIANSIEPVFELNEEPSLTGVSSLKLANQAADALILQYYEEPDAKKAAFGKKLNLAQWTAIARIKDVYGDVLFAAPIVAVNVANPLLKVMSNELALDGRKFTFLCGHDSNIASVLSALGAEYYSLPNSIEKKTPIGSKFVIEKWHGSDGREYAKLKLVYQSTKQLRERTMLNLDTPPEIYALSLRGLEKNADGYYRLDDVQKRFSEAIDAYERLK